MKTLLNLLINVGAILIFVFIVTASFKLIPVLLDCNFYKFSTSCLYGKQHPVDYLYSIFKNKYN